MKITECRMRNYFFQVTFDIDDKKFFDSATKVGGYAPILPLNVVRDSMDCQSPGAILAFEEKVVFMKEGLKVLLIKGWYRAY